jgi:hypothetical protein
MEGDNLIDGAHVVGEPVYETRIGLSAAGSILARR